MYELPDTTRLEIAAEMDRLRIAADFACDKLRPEDIDGAINWGDLGCVAANFCIDDKGQAYQMVIVEEAGPVNPALHAALRAELQRMGWGEVGIETTW